MSKSALSTLILVIISTLGYGQNSREWSIWTGYETNYSGNNMFLHTRVIVKEKHIVEGGLNYNLSDGYSSNPVIGVGLAYGYNIISSTKWVSTIGVEYRRQKPIPIVNVQTICYTSSLQYNIDSKFSMQTKIGYGLAAERNASAGNFSQFNNITGLFSLGCGYSL